MECGESCEENSKSREINEKQKANKTTTALKRLLSSWIKGSFGVGVWYNIIKH